MFQNKRATNFFRIVYSCLRHTEVSRCCLVLFHNEFETWIFW